MEVAVDMQGYLAEIRPAVELLLPGIWAERGQLAELRTEVERLYSTMVGNYAQVDAIVSSDIPDDDGIATALYWDTYFGEDKEHHHKSIDLKELEEKVQARTFAADALAGTLLQFAKQGISIVHNGFATAPAGRALALLARKADRATVGLHYQLRNRQAEAAPEIACSVAFELRKKRSNTCTCSASGMLAAVCDRCV
jgi:hypothetical protein